MNTIFLIALTLLALLTAFAVPRLFSGKTANLRRYEEYATTFYQKADALLSDDETPDELVDSIESMVLLVSDKRAAPLFLRSLFRRASEANGRRNKKQLDENFRAVVEPFFARRQELARAYEEATAACVMAMIWNGTGLSGYMLRTLFRGVVSIVDVAKIMRRIEATKRNDDRFHPGSGHAHAHA